MLKNNTIQDIHLAHLNWYDIQKFAQTIESDAFVKEAGVWDKALSGALLWAAMLVLNGVDEVQAGQIAKVSPSQVSEVMKNPQAVAVAKNVATGQQEKIDNIKKQLAAQPKPIPGISLGTIVQNVLTHENLDSKQTPFRITNKKMRNWDTIYGFKIDKAFQPPANKKNFLYLKNQKDVVPAVTALFKKYNENPTKYNLPENPTLEQAIRMFDQSGANGKIAFLKKAIPGLDVTKKLKDFIF